MEYYMIKMKLIRMKSEFISMKLNFMHFLLATLSMFMLKRTHKFSCQRMKSDFNWALLLSYTYIYIYIYIYTYSMCFFLDILGEILKQAFVTSVT